MKMVMQLIISALVGFVVVTLILNIEWLDFSVYMDMIIIGLYLFTLILLGWSLLRHRQIKKLSMVKFEGDEEDEMDFLRYKKFTDYSFFTQSSSIIALLALCLATIYMESLVLIVIGIILTLISLVASSAVAYLMRFVYPDRNIPDPADSKYAVKMLEISDEGEKHIILNGLYRSHSLLNIVLIIAIVASTIYSVAAENSQVFSVVMMSIVLLIVNGKYVLSIRNK